MKEDQPQANTDYNSTELLNLSKALLDFRPDTFDYENLTCEICRISGAEYGVFNLYSPDRKKFRSQAIYGKSLLVSKVYELLGFKLKHKEWEISPARLNELQRGHLVRLESISDLAKGVIPDTVSRTVASTLNIGSVYIVEITANENVLGDFILFFSRGSEIINKSVVSAFANLVGVAISREKDVATIKERDEEFKILTDRMTDVLWTCDLQFNATWVSPSVEKVLGFTVEERLKQPPYEVFPPHSQEQAVQIMASELLADKESDPDRTITVKFDYYHKDGSIRVLENSMSFIRNSEGVPVGIHGLSRDITERQKAEENLLKAKEQLERAGYMAKIGTWEVDFTTRDVYWSEVVRQILDVPPDKQLRLDDILDYYKEGDSRNRMYELVDKSRKNGEPFDEEFILIGHDGKEHWVRNIVHPILVDNECVRMVGTSQDITEKKLAENKLKESEQNYKYLQDLYRKMADIIPDMMWAKDCEGKYLFTNNSVCKNLLGAADTQEPVGKNDLFFSARSRNSNPLVSDWHTFGENCLNSDQEIINSGEAGQFDEYGNVRGKFLYLDVVKSPLRDDSGNIIGTVGTARDVTEKRKNEKKLQESEANLKAIIENTLENIWSVNTSFEIQYVNEVFAKAFQFVFGEELRIGGNIINVLPPDLRPVWKERYERAFRNEHFLFEDKITTNGNTIFIEVAMNPIIIGDKVVGAALYGRDVTEKTLAQVQINYLSELRKILVDLSSSFINLPVNELRSAIYGSLESIGRFVGADRAYVFEYNFEKRTASNTIEWCRKGISKQIDNMQDVPLVAFEKWVRMHREGKAVSARIDEESLEPEMRQLMQEQDIKSLITIPLVLHGDCLGFVGFDSVPDFHEYTENENQLLQVYAQMLMNVQDRIEREKKLVIAKEKAEESERLKTAFLANMSHEIRTPMNGILGFLDLMRSPELSEENRTSYSKIVIQSGNRLLSTLNDIIEISKIETTEMKVSLSAVNIGEMMKYFLAFFLPQAEEKGLVLKLAGHLSDDKAMIQTDKSKLESMLSNLLKNAIKFTARGSIEFGSYIEGNSLVFRVKDTGPGISPDLKEQIFRRFIQGDMSSTRHYEGAGLGLSIVKAYAELLNGRVWVESEPDQGAAFFFSVPYVPDPTPASPISENVRQTGTVKSGITVLVVEDDPAGYLYLEKILQSVKIKVIHTDNGPDTVSTVHENKTIDLILMDIKIPGFSGIEATKEIRKFNSSLPIIAQTAYAFPTDRDAAIDAGCNDYITKPINRTDLLRLIKKYTGT
jgi:PAS domain S-box-containing protein